MDNEKIYQGIAIGFAMQSPVSEKYIKFKKIIELQQQKEKEDLLKKWQEKYD